MSAIFSYTKKFKNKSPRKGTEGHDDRALQADSGIDLKTKAPVRGRRADGSITIPDALVI